MTRQRSGRIPLVLFRSVCPEVCRTLLPIRRSSCPRLSSSASFPAFLCFLLLRFRLPALFLLLLLLPPPRCWVWFFRRIRVWETFEPPGRKTAASERLPWRPPPPPLLRSVR